MAILRKTYIPLLLILMGVTSCYEEFEPRVDTKPVLCINSLITAGDTVKIHVTHTWLYSDVTGEEDHEVNDATVSLMVNGVNARMGYVAQEGDHIRIEASSPTYGEAWAEVTVPYAADLTGFRYEPKLVSTTWDEEGDTGVLGLNVNIEVDIKDPEGVNFYQYEYSSYGHSYEEEGYEDEWGWEHWPVTHEAFSIGNLDDNAEPLFREHMDVFESAMEEDAGGFSFFTDRQIDGKAYTIHMNFRGASLTLEEGWDESWLDCGYDICINSVSESWYKWGYYDWQTGWMAIGDLADVGLGNAIWGYSNVSTGAGIVAARAVTYIRVPLRDFLLQTMM